MSAMPDYNAMSRAELIEAMKRLMREELEIRGFIEKSAEKALTSVRIEMQCVRTLLSLPDEPRR